MPTHGRRFDVALSFPGEHRQFVEEIATILAAALGREAVLYDFFHRAELARFDSDTYLQKLYHDESKLIAVFLCAEYAQKEWCGLEWRAVRDLIKKRKVEMVMPFRFDDTEIPGFYSIDGYVSLMNCTPEEVAQLILGRLAINAKILPKGNRSTNKPRVWVCTVESQNRIRMPVEVCKSAFVIASDASFLDAEAFIGRLGGIEIFPVGAPPTERLETARVKPTWPIKIMFEPRRATLVIPRDLRLLGISPSAGEICVVCAVENVLEVWRSEDWLRTLRTSHDD